MDWHQGNATHDRDEKGWLIGYFATGERAANHSDDVEVKWADHSSGDAQTDWETSSATSVSILVAGGIDIFFTDGTAQLREPGDYVKWEPGVKHRFRAPERATLITVRWPSRPPE